MDGFAPRRRWPALVLAAAWVLPACSTDPAAEDLPDAGETMARVGRRLAGSLSVQELSALATDGDRLLTRLTPAERDALGRGSLRFRVDRPSVVEVAAPGPAFPFWLDDQGFRRDARPLRVDGGGWALFRKRVPAGWVGLGVNGLDRSPKAHYLVFVRAEGPGSAPSTTPRLLPTDPGGWRCLPAREGTSAASGVSLPIGPLPDDLRGAWLLQPSHDRRHASMLARGRVWKTHVVSGHMPDQVAVAFGPDPARSLAWTWRTDPAVRATVLRLAPAGPGAGGSGPDPSRPFRTIPGDSRVVDTPELLNDPAILRHRVVAGDLKPDTAYSYSVGDGTPGGWSPWKTVRTGPAGPRSFGFLYMGDPQCGLEDWGRLLAESRLRHPDSAFLLIAGDLVDRGNERTNWDHFFLRAAGVFETLPLLPCAGNHEYLDKGPRLYRDTFELPANGPDGIDPGLVYSFEYGDAFVAVLDSTSAVSDPGSAREQAEWLDAALGRTRATWKFVMFHHPIYASHPTRECPGLGEAWVPVFDRHGVDLVLQGHDHAYLRTYPLRAGRRESSPGRGTTYVVAVSGTKYCDQRVRPETEVGFTHRSTYQTIDVEVPGNRLVYRAWDLDGRELDRFTIEKPVPPSPIAGR